MYEICFISDATSQIMNGRIATTVIDLAVCMVQSFMIIHDYLQWRQGHKFAYNSNSTCFRIGWKRSGLKSKILIFESNFNILLVGLLKKFKKDALGLCIIYNLV